MYRNMKSRGNSMFGKVGYLTIDESYVEENTSQRRGGVHTENPGHINLRRKNAENANDFNKGSGMGGVEYYEHHWG